MRTMETMPTRTPLAANFASISATLPPRTMGEVAVLVAASTTTSGSVMLTVGRAAS